MIVEENSIQRTVTVPVGNYSRKSFRSVLQTQLNTSAESGYVYSITYDQSSSVGDTGKYTFSCQTISPQPKFIVSTGLYEQLGLEKNTTYTFVGDTLTSVNVMNFRARTRLILKSDICQNFNNNILHYITSIDADYNYLNFQNQNPYFTYKDFVISSSNLYKFQLLDENLNSIDLNGLPISFTVMLWRENDIGELIENYIKMKVLNEK